MSRRRGWMAGLTGGLVLVIALVTLPGGSTQRVTAAAGATWSLVTPLPGPRIRPAAAVGANGNIYVFGGNNSGVDYNTTFIYHPGTNSWTQGANMPTAREGAQAVYLSNGNIAILGGGQNCGNQYSGCTVLSVVEIYSPTINSWTTAAPMLTPRYRFAAWGGNGHIYAVGGWGNGQALSTAETYNAATNSWSYLPSLPVAEEAPAAALANGKLTVMGGSDGQLNTTYFNSTWIFNPGTGWSIGAPMLTAREDFGAVTGPDGQIYAMGGYNTSGFLAAVEAYNASTNNWSSVTPMPVVTCCMAAVTGLNGLIYSVGGSGGTQMAVLNVNPTPPTATPTAIVLPTNTPTPVTATATGAVPPTATPTITPSRTSTTTPTATPTATSTRTAVPTSSATSTPAPTLVNVPAALPWTDTGIDVTAGEVISITASGTISIDSSTDVSPVGQSTCVAGESMVAPGLTCYMLVARIGNGVPFAVGTGITWQATTSGRLGLGINDGIFYDNTGSFSAQVTAH